MAYKLREEISQAFILVTTGPALTPASISTELLPAVGLSVIVEMTYDMPSGHQYGS